MYRDFLSPSTSSQSHSSCLKNLGAPASRDLPPPLVPSSYEAEVSLLFSACHRPQSSLLLSSWRCVLRNRSLPIRLATKSHRINISNRKHRLSPRRSHSRPTLHHQPRQHEDRRWNGLRTPIYDAWSLPCRRAWRWQRKRVATKALGCPPRTISPAHVAFTFELDDTLQVDCFRPTGSHAHECQAEKIHSQSLGPRIGFAQ